MSVVNFTWTDEHVELLKKLWRDNLSASRIATEFGGAVTKNAVIGKIHRLGLTRDVPKAVKPARKPAVSSPMVVVIVRQKPPAAAFPAVVAPPSEPPPGYMKLLDLRDEHCRWPAGELAADIRFCGAPRVMLGPYCAYHTRKASVPPRKSERNQSALHRKTGDLPG